jgi:hypothetical protein
MQYATKVYLRAEVRSKFPNLGNKLKCSTSSNSGRLTPAKSKEFRKVLNPLENTDKTTNKLTKKYTNHHWDNYFKNGCIERSFV